MAKPSTMSMCSCMSCMSATSTPNTSRMSHSDRPIRAKDATHSPMVRPLRKLTVSALATDASAACAVRVLARVATYMPTKPAAADSTPPVMNASAVHQVSAKPMTTATTTMNTTSSLYSLMRNAWAPCWIFSEMPFILSEPGSCLRTHLPR